MDQGGSSFSSSPLASKQLARIRKDEDGEDQMASSSLSPTRPSSASADKDRRRIPESVPSPIRRTRGPFSAEDDGPGGGGEVQSIRAWVGGTSALLFHYPMEQEALAMDDEDSLDERRSVTPPSMPVAPTGRISRAGPDHRMPGFLSGGSITSHTKGDISTGVAGISAEHGTENCPHAKKSKMRNADDRHIPAQESAAVMLQR